MRNDSKRPESYTNSYLKRSQGVAERELSSNRASAAGSQAHSSARKAPLASAEVKTVASKTRAANELAGSHMKQAESVKVRGESESSVKMGTSGSASGSALRAGVDLDAQNFSSALTVNNNY